MAFTIRHFVLPVPFWDEWEWTQLIYRNHLGNLRLSDVWAQHNEHRMLFPNAIVIGLAMLGGWSQLRETLFSLLLVVLTQIGLLIMLRRIVSPQRLPFAFLCISLLLYSLAQIENWDWGFQIAWFLCNVCAVWVLVFLGAAGQSWFALIAAIGLAEVGSFSSSQGLMIWIAGFAALCLTEKRNPAQIATWAVCGVGAYVLYFHDFIRPAAHPDVLLGLHHPLTVFRYYGAYFGTMFGGWLGFGAAVTLGWAGLIALGAMLALFARDYLMNRSSAARVAGFAGLAVYALATAAITTAGRVGFGPAQAEASRYTSIALCAWIAVVALAAAYAGEIQRRLSPTLVKGWPALALGFAVLYIGADRSAVDLGEARLNAVRSAYPALALGHGAQLTAIYPAQALVEEYIKELRTINDGPYYQ